MVLLMTLTGLLVMAALATPPEVWAKLRASLCMWLLVLLTVWRCLIPRFQRGERRAASEDAATKSVLVLIVILILMALTREPEKQVETRLISLSFWVPRKYREAITGDILEDCHDMRELGFAEQRILAHVLWQFAWAVIRLWPEVVGSAVAAVVKHVWKITKE